MMQNIMKAAVEGYDSEPVLNYATNWNKNWKKMKTVNILSHSCRTVRASEVRFTQVIALVLKYNQISEAVKGRLDIKYLST